MLGDIGQPDLIGGLGAELTLHEVVVHRWPGSTVQSSLLGEDRPDALLGTQPCDAVLAGGDPAPGKFVGNESVAEGGVIGMDVAGGVDQVRIVPITLRERRFAPFVEGLGGEPQDPAGHLDGDPVIGKVEDQRVHHFGLASRDR